jgi:hypothetical protein
MYQIVFSVYDTKSEAFSTPFFMASHGMAIRAFEDQVNSPDSGLLYLHSSDFTLYRVGTYDDASGTLVPEVPLILSSALELRSEEVEERLTRRKSVR